jgi:iron complex outermembrane receptor protein
VEGRDLTHRDTVRSPALVSSRRGGPETEPLPGIPPLEIRSGLRVHESVTEKDKSPKWSVECSVRNAFDQNLVAASLGELPTPGFTVVDLRAYWQANEHWTFATGVENIGDKNYREHLDPRAGDLLFRPGVNFYMTTQLKY